MIEVKNWWELPDRTLVRGSDGEIRQVIYDADGVRWLHHFSDEYSTYFVPDGAPQRTPGVHSLGDSVSYVTVVNIVD